MSILQELLNLGLVDIGADDSRFEKMQAASESLSARLGEEPALLIPSTLVALDHDVDENDPVFDVVEELVLAQWKTMRNTHANRPRELLRSVLLDALSRYIDGKPQAAGVVSYTAAGPVRHGQAKLGKEAAIVERLINGAWRAAETEAVRCAGLLPAPKLIRPKKVSAKPPTISISAAVSDDELVESVARAAGPQYPHGHPLPDPNPQWSNSNHNWSHHFSPRMASALARSVNLGTARLTASLGSALSSYLNDLEERVADQLAKVADVSAATTASTEASLLRLEVLWWSEALFSPSLGLGYRDLPLSVAAVSTAIDLTNIVPPLAPTSVIYVLGEAVHRVAGVKGGGAGSLGSYLDGLGEDGALVDALPMRSGAGRVPLLELVSEAAAGSALTKDEIAARSGVDADLQLSAADFAMWVFRDLQARRLVEEN